MLVVEVLEAMPGRPISGERLVRPDGKISLGFYGEIDVAGLTVMEAKEKIVRHLRKFLQDDILGLTEEGEGKFDGDVPPNKFRNTDRVFVEVTTYNSKNYYVQGAVQIPGRLPITGHETVLDAIDYAGGLSLQADHDKVVLYRKEKNGTLQRLPINVDQIMMGDDPTTNYQLLPGDRLVIPFKPGAGSDDENAADVRPSAERRERTGASSRTSRRDPEVRSEPDEDRAVRRSEASDDPAALRDLGAPAGRVERKLDRVLQALERLRALTGGVIAGFGSCRLAIASEAGPRYIVMQRVRDGPPFFRRSDLHSARRLFLELSGERTAMIPLSKTALVLSVIVCGALTVGIRAQGPDEPQPRPRPRPRQEGSARPAPRPAPENLETDIGEPARPAPSDTAPAPFVGPPGLSEEAMRSFREIPPSIVGEEMEAPSDEPPPPVVEVPASQRPPRAAPPLSSRTTPARIQPRPEYIVEPPDMLIVEVLETLPGRPISGERLVRPDGRISLGFYGEVPVAGLTLPQIKERIVLHLRKFITDETLGLLAIDVKTGSVKRDQNGRIVVTDPRETDRVFVDVTAYNSQHYYVLGEVLIPRRLPYTGGDTVLDLVEYAGGLLATADKSKIRLIRSYPKGSPARVLPVDYEEIAIGDRLLDQLPDLAQRPPRHPAHRIEPARGRCGPRRIASRVSRAG